MSYICGDCHQEHKVPKREEDEQEKASECNAGLACVLALVRERDEIKLKLSEALVALKIAKPSTIHVVCGHVYDSDGRLVEFVDGCARCRIERILDGECAHGDYEWAGKEATCGKCGKKMEALL